MKKFRIGPLKYMSENYINNGKMFVLLVILTSSGLLDSLFPNLSFSVPVVILTFGYFYMMFVGGKSFQGYKIGYHNNSVYTYQDQVNNYYVTSLHFLGLCIFLVLATAVLDINSQPFMLTNLIKLIYLYVPINIMTLSFFFKEEIYKYLIFFLTLMLSGTMFWLFYVNMIFSGDNIIFTDVLSLNIVMNGYIVVGLVILLHLIILKLVKSIALKIYKPNLPGGVE